MKPEPLKGKIKRNGASLDYPVDIDKHIKSAVEWLKNKLNETEMLTDEKGAYISNSMDLPTALKIVNKAFEDVMKKDLEGGKDEMYY